MVFQIIRENIIHSKVLRLMLLLQFEFLLLFINGYNNCTGDEEFLNCCKQRQYYNK